MVPYQSTRSTRSTQGTTYIVNSDSTTSTALYENYYHEGDELWFSFTAIKEEEIPILIKEKPRFDRIMKMRNTDGKPMKYSIWKPVRMYCGRDNIGVRNFKKVKE